MPGATISAYFAANRRLVGAVACDVELVLVLSLEDMTLVSNAICTTMLANALDMNVMTFGSLLSRLSHHRNGLSTQPPSKVPSVIQAPEPSTTLLRQRQLSRPGYTRGLSH